MRETRKTVAVPARTQSHTQARAAWLAVWLLWIAIAGGGCGQERFEFIVTDESGRPIEGGTIFYYPNGDPEQERVLVGQTDASGSLILSGDALAEGTWYLFEKACAISVAGERFDPGTCSIISGGAQGRYRFSRKDGLLRKGDLRDPLPGKDWPGRRVQLTCEAIPASAGGEDPAGGRRQSLTRILDLTSTPGAEVRVNGRPVAWVPESGWLNESFCPGDSLACFAATCRIEIRLEGHDTVERQVALPEPAGRIQLEAPLEPISSEAGAGGAASRTGTLAGASTGGTSTAGASAAGGALPAGYARVRIANQGFPQTCGEKGDRWPVLHVDRLGVSVESTSDQAAWKAYYDLMLPTGRSYKVAIECPQEGQTAHTWTPWDEATGLPQWYRIEVPGDATELYFAVPTFSAGDPLELRPTAGTWRGFRESAATRID